MTWLGLDWDEGPLHQADGLERHRATHRLLDTRHAYRCFCTAEQLEQRGAGPRGARRLPLRPPLRGH
jgi:glutamyl/glutaminyl-tRNA synthetase